MATSFSALCTDFYVNQKLALKMDLPDSRETVFDLLERIRKSRPSMNRFRRYDGEVALESVAENGVYDWISLRSASGGIIRSGVVNPDTLPAAFDFHRLVLETAPYYLSVSPLDVDYLELAFGFDLEASGNHDEIVFEALLADTPLGKLVDKDAALLDVQPFITFALNQSGLDRIEANVEIKTRPSAPTDAPVGEFDDRLDDEPISVFLSLRRLGPLSRIDELPSVLELLAREAERLASDRIVPLLVSPISRAIESRPPAND